MPLQRVGEGMSPAPVWRFPSKGRPDGLLRRVWPWVVLVSPAVPARELGVPAPSLCLHAETSPRYGWCHVATRPPSTASVTPCTKLASSLARKAIAAASSSG